MNRSNINEIKTLRPSWRQFKNFEKYMVDVVEKSGYLEAGAVKIIPPSKWKPRSNPINLKDSKTKILKNLEQNVEEIEKGVYFLTNIKKNEIKVSTFIDENEKADASSRPSHPDKNDPDKEYWEKLTQRKPQYGVDVHESLIDENCTVWNINKLDSILNKHWPDGYDGITSSYLYFGMYGASFAWHTEDYNLPSINVVLAGASKIWYVIPASDADKFEALANKLYPEEKKHSGCKNFISHKNVIIHPSVIRDGGITINRVEQKENEIIITAPRAYHCGHNTGFNVAEATNFATPYWIEFGKRVVLCSCVNNDMVYNDMKEFVRIYQPEKYDDWLAGNDYGLTNPANPNVGKSFAPKPFGIKKKGKKSNLAHTERKKNHFDKNIDEEYSSIDVLPSKRRTKCRDDQEWAPSREKRTKSEVTPAKAPTPKKRGRPRKKFGDGLWNQGGDAEHASSPAKKNIGFATSGQVTAELMNSCSSVVLDCDAAVQINCLNISTNKEPAETNNDSTNREMSKVTPAKTSTSKKRGKPRNFFHDCLWNQDVDAEHTTSPAEKNIGEVASTQVTTELINSCYSVEHDPDTDVQILFINIPANKEPAETNDDSSNSRQPDVVVCQKQLSMESETSKGDVHQGATVANVASNPCPLCQSDRRVQPKLSKQSKPSMKPTSTSVLASKFPRGHLFSLLAVNSIAAGVQPEIKLPRKPKSSQPRRPTVTSTSGQLTSTRKRSEHWLLEKYLAQQAKAVDCRRKIKEELLKKEASLTKQYITYQQR